MSRDEDKIKEIKNSLSEFDLRGLNFANFTQQEEVRFHEYIKGICQRLLGDTLNLDEKNIIFALSDKNEVNAAYVSKGNIDIIYITEKLLNLCKNEDQLAFILGHELGHYEEAIRQGAGKKNSKAEETACDLRSIQKMARGGYNLEEACNIASEIFDKRSISIKDLKDPHTNDSSRVNLINAIKKKEKDRIIEEQNIEITESTPISSEILEMVRSRPQKPPLSESLYLQMLFSGKNKDGSTNDEEKIAIWLQSFHEHIISDGRHYTMTRDDIKALSGCIDRFFYENDKFADKFLAAVFADMNSMQNDVKSQASEEIMHSILDQIWSSDADYSKAVVNADEKDSKTAAWLRHYLRGFREAENENYDRMISNLEYVKNFVAKHDFDNYSGIYVKNFNLLELNFDESDIGKKFSPQILKYIKSNINAKDKFVTFSGLTAHKMGDALMLTHVKNNRSTFVNSSGEITHSFPSEDLSKMQTLLMKDIIESAQNNLEAVAEGKIPEIKRRLEILHEAHNIVSPVSRKNDLSSILEIRNKSNSAEDILYDDVAAVLSPDSKQFFAERLAETSKNLPHTQKITELYAEAIQTAPKEYFYDILDTLTISNISHRLHGEDKLLRAFLDNPSFYEELSQTIKSYEPFPEKSEGWDWKGLFESPDSSTKCRLCNLVSKIKEITDFKLKEHIENGGDFDNFDQPFKKDLAKLFDFATQRHIDEETALSELRKTRNDYGASATLYEQAYIAYSSYDFLRSDDQKDVKFLLGFNCAGVELQKRYYSTGQRLKYAEKYKIDQNEQIKIQERQQRLKNFTDKIHDRLVQHLERESENGNISETDVFYMTLYNKTYGNGMYGENGFETIISNFDFEKDILRSIENINNDSRDFGNLVSLEKLVKYFDKTKEQDEYKEKIWPSVATVFEHNNLSVKNKTTFFTGLVKSDIFASDYKRYYEVLIGRDGKSGLLSEINKTENPLTKFECYSMLLDEKSRIPDPEIRSDVIKSTAYSFWQCMDSYNDVTCTSESTRSEILLEIKKSIKSSSIAELDKVEVLKELSELIMSQKKLSLAMKPEEINLQASDSEAIEAAYGLDVVAYALQTYPETKISIQDFLLGEGTAEEASDLIEKIHIAMCKEHDEYYSPKVLDRYLAGEDVIDDLNYNAKDYYNKLNTQSCLHFKKEFDAAPLEVKALIVNEIITKGNADWEASFTIVSEKLFDGAGDLGKVGSDFLHSYIAARPNSEKTFYLAAMMAAANNKSKSSANYTDSPYSPEERNLAKGLRMFLENSGPAGTKLAQAMASYGDVPDFIRYEMQFAKSEANPPARWEIFSGNDQTMNKLLAYGPLGKRRGSASFFVTYDLGDKIVKIMRRGAKLKADNEFAIYSEMLQTLSSEYQNISSFKRLIQNAAANVHIETDLNIGQKQYEDAKKLYPQSVTADNVTFKIQVMDWIARDKEWALMDKAQGVDFKDLKEPYKTAAAKAVFTTELANMLSGKRFDSDRHGGQYKFDTQNSVIGVFDTGSMSMTEPTDKERQGLGIVLARTLKGMRHNPNIAAVFSTEIDKTANELYKNEIRENKDIPPYLSEFQRGMLALNDFYAHLSNKDMAECIIHALDNGKNKIHPQIVNVFKLEIKQSLDNRNVSIQDLLHPEKTDNLQPEARANRRVGKILFEALYQSISEGKKINLSSETSQKLFSRLRGNDTDLQIVKGVVRGAYAKLNPANYTQKDREELGMFLYHVCRTDLKNQTLKKGDGLENIIAEVSTKTPQMGVYTQNVMKLVSVMAKIPALSDNKLKKAAAFAAFADKDVSRGFKKALSDDKNVSFTKRVMLKLTPMDFVPRNAKKMLIKAVSKHFVADYVSKQLFGSNTKLSQKSKSNGERE